MNRTMKVISSVLWISVAASGGYFYGHSGNKTKKSTGAPAATGEYTCPMHPFIVQKHQGACGICGMELVQKVNGAEISGKDLRGIRHVAMSPAQQVMANLATSIVEVKPLSKTVSSTGVVAFNQAKQGKISAWLAGRIDRLHVNSVGSAVQKNKPVAEIYSVDLYNAQVQYLLAYKTIKILNSSVSVTFPINTHMALGEASERLRQLGFREEQFEQLQKADKPTIHIPVYSPFSGIVTEKLVKEGQYVNVGEPLFSIADLSTVWVELEVFETDFPFIRVGQDVTIHSRSYPGVPFRGTVKMIYPFLDAKTRTVKLRIELPNPGLKLKPEMYVQGSISIPMAAAMVIPATAVMDTGSRQVVWIESGPGIFQPRDVKTGIRSGKEVQILSGLKPGEKVAVTGGYLVDSEAQLSHGADPPAQPAAAPAAPVRKPAMDMNDMKMQ